MKPIASLSFVPKDPDDKLFMQFVIAKILELELKGPILNEDLDVQVVRRSKERGLWKDRYAHQNVTGKGRLSGENWVDHAKRLLTQCGIHEKDDGNFYRLTMGNEYTRSWASQQPFLDDEFLQDYASRLYVPIDAETPADQEIARKRRSDSVYIIWDTARADWHKIGCSIGDCADRLSAAKLWTADHAMLVARAYIGTGRAYTVETGSRQILRVRGHAVRRESVQCTLQEAKNAVSAAAREAIEPPILELIWHPVGDLSR
jgi:hypothetical protein